MIFQAAYLSSAKVGLSDGDVHDVLRVSKRNNVPAGISGMLLLIDQVFFQVLEGERLAVEETLKHITRDKRHNGIIHVLAIERPERHFPDWSMGFEKFIYREANILASDAAPFDIADIACNPTVSALAGKAPELISFMRSLYSGRHMRGAPALNRPA
jgi:hypothetical protein